MRKSSQIAVAKGICMKHAAIFHFRVTRMTDWLCARKWSPTIRPSWVEDGENNRVLISVWCGELVISPLSCPVLLCAMALTPICTTFARSTSTMHVNRIEAVELHQYCSLCTEYSVVGGRHGLALTSHSLDILPKAVGGHAEGDPPLR